MATSKRDYLALADEVEPIGVALRDFIGRAALLGVLLPQSLDYASQDLPFLPRKLREAAEMCERDPQRARAWPAYIDQDDVGSGP